MGPFFASLAEQEQFHADLLEICRAAAIRGGWKANVFNPPEDYLPRLEQQILRQARSPHRKPQNLPLPPSSIPAWP